MSHSMSYLDDNLDQFDTQILNQTAPFSGKVRYERITYCFSRRRSPAHQMIVIKFGRALLPHNAHIEHVSWETAPNIDGSVRFLGIICTDYIENFGVESIRLHPCAGFLNISGIRQWRSSVVETCERPFALAV